MKKLLIVSSLLALLSGTIFAGIQDPMKSSKYPNSDPPSSAPDGSSGKYRDSHKHANGRKFSKCHYHVKKVKKNKSKNIENRKESNTR